MCRYVISLFKIFVFFFILDLKIFSINREIISRNLGNSYIERYLQNIYIISPMIETDFSLLSLNFWRNSCFQHTKNHLKKYLQDTYFNLYLCNLPTLSGDDCTILTSAINIPKTHQRMKHSK